VLGSIDETNCWSTEPKLESREIILSKCEKLVPNIRSARILGEWTGLRPMRKGGVRLELEITENNKVSLIL
jgi:D-amino-acid oxidase